MMIMIIIMHNIMKTIIILTPEIAKVNLSWKTPLNIHWIFPVTINWISDVPLEHTTAK